MQLIRPIKKQVDELFAFVCAHHCNLLPRSRGVMEDATHYTHKLLSYTKVYYLPKFGKSKKCERQFLQIKVAIIHRPCPQGRNSTSFRERECGGCQF